MIGRTLDDRYAIVRLLGQGGMGAVYEARHTGTGRRVAVKIILGVGAQNVDHVARFEREARAVGAVESDYIAQVFDTGRDRETGAPYIAMEFLEGEDVQALIERLGPLPIDLALRIALQACLGLERAHAAGVIHRDIKPANLFLARKEHGARVVKLLDFGVAKITASGPEDHGLTKTGAMVGSPLYMSPEQARGSGGVDARSDLWSLGITLFQAIAGRRPNDGVQGLGELLILICSTPAPWLQTVAPWAPAEVAQVVRRALTIDPAARFGSAGEFADALRALLPYGHAIVDPMLVPLGATTRSFAAPQPPPLAQSAAVPAITLGTTGLDPRAVAVPPRRPVGLFVGGAAVLALLGAGGAYWARSQGAPLPAASGVAASASAIPAPPVSAAMSAAPAPAAPPLQPSAVVAPAPVASVPPGPLPIKRIGAPIKKVNTDDENSRK
jgi:serine/threonine-protein kinase